MHQFYMPTRYVDERRMARDKSPEGSIDSNESRFERRDVLKASVASALGISLAGCTGGEGGEGSEGGESGEGGEGGDEGSSDGQTTNLRLLNIQSTENTDWYDSLVKKVEQNTNIATESQWVSPEEYPTVMRTQFSGGQAPDASITDPHYMWNMAIDGLFRDMTDSYNWEKNKDRFYQPLGYDSVTRHVPNVGNAKWGIPFGIISESIFYYNREFFDDKGLKVPTTYSEMLDLKAELPDGTSPLLFPAGERWWGTIIYMIWVEHLSGADVGTSREVFLDSVKGDRKFTDPIHVKALRWTEKMAPHKDGIIGKEGLELGRSDALQKFVKGESGSPMFYTTTSAIPALKAAEPAFEIRAANPPVLDVAEGVSSDTKQTAPAGAIGTLATTTATNKVDSVMKVAETLLDPEVNRLIVEQTGTPSPVKASNDVLREKGGLFADLVDIVETTHVYGNWWYPDEVEHELTVGIQQLLRGQSSPEDVAQKAENAMAQIRGTDSDPYKGS